MMHEGCTMSKLIRVMMMMPMLMLWGTRDA